MSLPLLYDRERAIAGAAINDFARGLCCACFGPATGGGGDSTILGSAGFEASVDWVGGQHSGTGGESFDFGGVLGRAVADGVADGAIQ
jgi:hypothetical protein